MLRNNVVSGVKIQMLKITNFEVNRFTEVLKQTRKMRYNVIYNVQSLLILNMENTLKWERLIDKNEVKQKVISTSSLCHPLSWMNCKNC